ncbi:MAG TPA: hypothetical protein VMI10_03310 [Terriglobales bacterium]|nr:hypothetical protein [Terriglobales bacterium]
MKNLVNNVLSVLATFLVTSGMLNAQPSQTYSQAVAAHPDWVQVPGELIRPDCIHQIPAGATLSVSNDPKGGDDILQNGQVIAHYEACPEDAIVTRKSGGLVPSPGNGWVEDSDWVVSLKKGDNIDWLQNEFAVPKAPKTNGAVVFLFNGIEPTSGKWIMQPVLQYGPSAAGGGNYWAMASWLVSATKAYFSTLTAVNAGDLLVGTMEETDNSGGKLTYIVDAYDSASGADTNLTVHSKGIKWAWAFEGVLEAYNVTTCNNFPASGQVKFYNTTMAHGFPSFDFYSPLKFKGEFDNYSGGGGPSCGFSTSVSGGTATLKF